jgi:hypothetical protein
MELCGSKKKKVSSAKLDDEMVIDNIWEPGPRVSGLILVISVG